jgi:hypothetical protein
MEPLEELRRRWQSEDMKACTVLAARLPAEAAVVFAGTALAACLATLPEQQKELSDLVGIGEDRGRWAQAHAAFDAVRRLTLERERGAVTSQDPTYIVLFVAENAARVIYNAAGPTDPFDDDSAAWLLLTQAQMVRSTGSSELSDRIWELYRQALLPSSARSTPTAAIRAPRGFRA